jgi:hypothetical protein
MGSSARGLQVKAHFGGSRRDDGSRSATPSSTTGPSLRDRLRPRVGLATSQGNSGSLSPLAVRDLPVCRPPPTSRRTSAREERRRGTPMPTGFSLPPLSASASHYRKSSGRVCAPEGKRKKKKKKVGNRRAVCVCVCVCSVGPHATSSNRGLRFAKLVFQFTQTRD